MGKYHVVFDENLVRDIREKIRNDINLEVSVRDAMNNMLDLDRRFNGMWDMLYYLQDQIHQINDRCDHLEYLINNITETISKDIYEHLNSLITRINENSQNIH